MNIASLDIGLLGTRRDARRIDDAKVLSLADSIAEVGLINPIRVRPRRHFINGVEGDGYEVIAGAHRFLACLKLGLAEVACVLVNDDDLHAELAMIDENLCRADLSPADRASQTARRKVIYERLHTEAAYDARPGRAGKSRQFGDNYPAERFTADTSERTGRAERNIQRDAERGEKVCDEALRLVRGTDLDKGTYLDKLKKIETPEEQVATVNRALSGLARTAEREKVAAAAARNERRIEADVKERAAKEVAEILAHQVEGAFWDGLKANLYAAGARNIADAFTKLVGNSVMDAEAA